MCSVHAAQSLCARRWPPAWLWGRTPPTTASVKYSRPSATETTRLFMPTSPRYACCRAREDRAAGTESQSRWLETVRRWLDNAPTVSLLIRHIHPRFYGDINGGITEGADANHGCGILEHAGIRVEDSVDRAKYTRHLRSVGDADR